MKTIDEQGYHFEEWLTPQEIAQDVAQVADRISKDYQEKEPLFVVVLNGAFVFAADLIRALKDIRCEVTFIRVSSYWGMSSTGQLEFIVPLQQVVENRDVIIVEDIVDTGRTLALLMEQLQKRNPASLKVCTAFDKPARRVNSFVPDYNGLTVPDEFIVGYGLDLDGEYRNFDDIRIVRKV